MNEYCKINFSECYINKCSEKPMIEKLDMNANETLLLDVSSPKVLFVLEGKINLLPELTNEIFVTDKEILIVGLSGEYNIIAQQNCKLLLIRIYQPINPCISYFNQEQNKEIEIVETQNSDSNISIRKINLKPVINYFIKGLEIGLSDEVECRCWTEIKAAELVLLLRFYYPDLNLDKVFNPPINEVQSFKEYIEKHWELYPSVKLISRQMKLSYRQFTSRFKHVFGITPGKWIIIQKTQIVYKEIISTNKPFKQIAIENNFTSDSVFTRFCKEKLGDTPSNLRYSQ